MPLTSTFTMREAEGPPVVRAFGDSGKRLAAGRARRGQGSLVCGAFQTTCRLVGRLCREAASAGGGWVSGCAARQWPKRAALGIADGGAARPPGGPFGLLGRWRQEVVGRRPRVGGGGSHLPRGGARPGCAGRWPRRDTRFGRRRRRARGAMLVSCWGSRCMGTSPLRRAGHEVEAPWARRHDFLVKVWRYAERRASVCRRRDCAGGRLGCDSAGGPAADAALRIVLLGGAVPQAPGCCPLGWCRALPRCRGGGDPLA